MIDVLQEGLTRIEPISSFSTAGLHPAMARNVELCGYKTPTPIQRYCIPAIKMGHDIIAIAQTGKSTLPYLHRLISKRIMPQAKLD
jgi:ATP-dependent RNA helicase DDX3X